MEHVAVEDAYHCIDREALEQALIGEGDLEEKIRGHFHVVARMTEMGTDLSLDITIGCDPASRWCERYFTPQPAQLETAHLARTSCSIAHDLVLTQVRSYLEPWEIPPPPKGSRGDDASAPSTWAGFGLDGGPRGLFAPRLSLGMTHYRAALSGSVRLGLGAKTLLGAPISVALSPSCSPPTSPLCTLDASVGSAGLQGRASVRAAELGHLWLEGELALGALALWGSGYPRDRLALVPLIDAGASVGLLLGGLAFATDLRCEPIRIGISPPDEAARTALWRAGLSFTTALSPSRDNR